MKKDPKQGTLTPYLNKDELSLRKREDLKSIAFPEFLRKLNDIGYGGTNPDEVPLSLSKGILYPRYALLSFMIFYISRGYGKVTKALKDAARENLFGVMGFLNDYPPNSDVVSKFKRNDLGREGMEDLTRVIKDAMHDNSWFLEGMAVPNKTETAEEQDLLPHWSSRDKRKLALWCLSYITEHAHVNLRHNARFTTKTLFEAITYALCDASTVHSFSVTHRDDPIPGRKIRQRAPCDKTLFIRLRRIFHERLDVLNFFDALFKKMIMLAKEKCPEVFNRRALDLAFDHTSIPSYDNLKKYAQKKLNPESLKRRVYVNPADVIGDAHIKGKGTVYFWKYLVVSIIIKGLRFAIAYLPINMYNNPNQSSQLNNVINRIKTVINPRYIRRIYLDRGFDNKANYRLLAKRGIRFIMGKKRDAKGPITRKINAVEGDIAFFKHRFSRNMTFNIIVSKASVKNLYLYKRDKESNVADTQRKKFAFITNCPVSKENVEELLSGYSCRWSIETMFRDKNKLFGRTTSCDAVIKDFYFSYSLILFNLWVVCNIILAIWYYKEELGKPKMQIITMRNYLKGVVFDPPPDEPAFF
jgi:hypothetical protein